MVPDTHTLAHLWRETLLTMLRSGALVLVVFASTSLAFFVCGEPLLLAVEHTVWLLLAACAVVGSSLALVCIVAGVLMFAASIADRRL